MNIQQIEGKPSFHKPRRGFGHSHPALLFAVMLLGVGLLSVAGRADAGEQIQWPPKNSTFSGAWPTQWTRVDVLNDLREDVAPQKADIISPFNFVGDSNNPGFYIAKKTVDGAPYLFFRIRVNWDGTVTEPPCTVPTPPAPPTACTKAAPFDTGTILLFVQSGSGTKPEYAFAWDFKEEIYNHGMEMLKLLSGGGTSSWATTKMKDVDTDPNGNSRGPPDFNNEDRLTAQGWNASPIKPPYFGKDAYVRTVNSVTRVGDGTGCTDTLGATVACQVTGTTTFVDFAIRCDYLAYVTGFTPTATVSG